MRGKLSRASLFVFASLLSVNLLGAEPSDPLPAEVRDALQESFRVSKDNREAVVLRLVDLYGQLASADAVNDAQRTRMQTQLRARLARLSAIIRRQMEIDASAKTVSQAVPDRVIPARIAPAANEILAQQAFLPRGPAPGAFRGGAIGPAGGFPRAPALGIGPNRAALAGGPPDNGQALVDLIQRTIAPASWDVNGGPGAIVYFRPSRVLVVRQRSEVHEQLQDVVGALRR
jgi:hypothetical protein